MERSGEVDRGAHFQQSLRLHIGLWLAGVWLMGQPMEMRGLLASDPGARIDGAALEA